MVYKKSLKWTDTCNVALILPSYLPSLSQGQVVACSQPTLLGDGGHTSDDPNTFHLNAGQPEHDKWSCKTVLRPPPTTETTGGASQLH